MTPQAAIKPPPPAPIQVAPTQMIAPEPAGPGGMILAFVGIAVAVVVLLIFSDRNSTSTRAGQDDPGFVIMEWLLYFLTVGGVGAAIGQSKSRTAAGFLFGFLLGPLGWLVVGFGPDLGPKCPACMGSIVAGASKCKNCGTPLSWVQA